jgi:hypothetical protein
MGLTEGTYYLSIYSDSGTGSYQLQYSYNKNTPGCMKDGTDIGVLSCGIKNHGTKELKTSGVPNGHVYSFKIDTVDIGSFRVESNSTQAIVMQLYDGEWNKIGNATESRNLNLTDLPVGDYNLLVYGKNNLNTNVSYNLWSFRLVNQCHAVDWLQSTAPQLLACGVGKSVSGNYTAPGGTLETPSIHRLDLNYIETELLTSKFELDYSNSGKNLDMWVFNVQWNLVLKSTQVSGSKKRVIHYHDLSSNGVIGQTYYVVVFNTEGGTGSGTYTLSSQVNTFGCNKFDYDLGTFQCSVQVGIVDYGEFNIPDAILNRFDTGVIFRFYLPETSNPSQATRILAKYASGRRFDARTYIRNPITGALTAKPGTDSANRPIAYFEGKSAELKVDMKDWPRGEYYLLVYGYNSSDIGNFTLKSIYNTHTCYTSTNLGTVDNEGEESSEGSTSSNEPGEP